MTLEEAGVDGEQRRVASMPPFASDWTGLAGLSGGGRCR